MTYQEAIQYLESFVNYEKLDGYDYKKSFNLERMRKLAGLLGNPQNGASSIHIAGSKGKGSTAKIVYSILKNSNFKVGLYTSPHMTSFRERIRINDELISEEDVCALLEKIKDIMAKMEGDLPSFFEVYTALAYLYFKERKADFVVYETGLGGRLDATNIIGPLVCAITPISYEHTEKLGGTLREIAGEKAGIIKDGTICVSAPQEDEALEAIKEACENKRAKLILVGRDIFFEELTASDRKEVFSVLGMLGEYPMLKSRLLGSHQVVNAAVAIGVVEALRLKGVAIPPDAIRTGIEDASWEGRFEIVSRRPYIVLDGAQNRASANALAKAVRKILRYKKLILVLGVSKDKDIKGMLEELLPISDSVILTKSKVVARALEPSKIKEYIKGKDAILTSNVEEALEKAASIAKPEDLLLITGSLFVVGEARERLLKTQMITDFQTRINTDL